MTSQEPTLDDLAWLTQDARDLLRAGDSLVPFVGTGISRGANLPAADLEKVVREMPEVRAVGLAEQGLFETVDEVLTRGLISEPDLVGRVCDELDLGRGYDLTEAVLALARVPSRIVVTLNYDLLIEEAAQSQGIDVRTLGISDADFPEIRAALTGAIHDDVVRVIHLHGSLIAPDEIVLSAGTYRRPPKNVSPFLTLLCAHRTICFVGTTLDEVYLLREIEKLRPLHTAPAHVLVTDAANAEKIQGRAVVSKYRHGILVEAFETNQWNVFDTLLPILSRAPRPPAREVVLAASERPDDERYVKNLLIPLTGASDRDDDSLSMLASVGLRHSLTEEDVASFGRRTVIVGAPGSGKTALLRRVGVLTPETEHPVFLPVASLSSVGTGSELLEAWSRDAESLRGEQPIGADALRDLRFHFLLDGLDEAPPERQESLAKAIVRAADTFPQHRFTLASRLVPSIDLFDMEIWGHLALRPGPDWRERFLDSEGVEWGEMLDAVPALHDIDELLQLPFFLRTAVDLWKHGALEGVDGVNALIDRLLDNAIASEDGGLPPEGLRFWLRKIAAALQLAGRLGISDEELATIPLPDELAARGTSKELVEELLAKPILRRTAEGYRFAHRLIGERLVADELVEIGPSPGALEVVAPVVTESIHGLNQVWAVPAILAAVQSPAWREALAARDPLAAALSTPPLAPREERLAAGRRIWQTYIDWQIWLFSGREFDLLEPGAVLTQLLNSGDLPELVDEVVGALHDDSAYTRGNALQLVGRLGLQDRISDDELGRMLTDDENGVVRRFAATAAARLSRHDLLPKIAERLGAATDSVERQDLCYAAADLATDDELRELGVRYAEGGIDTMYLATASERRLDPKSRLEVIRAHAERDAQPIPSDRQKLIELLARFPAEDIAAEDVERAGFIAAAWHLAEPEVIGFLAHHPEDALRGFQAAISSETTYAYEHELAAFSECFDPDLLRAAGVTDQVVGWVDERRRQTEAGTP